MKTTLTGGLLVLLPLFGCIYLVVLIASAFTNFIKPILELLPQNRFINPATLDLAAIIILVLMCFLTGVIIKTTVGKKLEATMTSVLSSIPGYRILWNLARILVDEDDPRGSPVVVDMGDNKQIGFLVDHHGSDESTIFLPNPPGPLSGAVLIVKADTVKKLNVSPSEVVRVMAAFGTGTSTLLAKAAPDHDQRDTPANLAGDSSGQVHTSTEHYDRTNID